jgi:hypothetical protein
VRVRSGELFRAAVETPYAPTQLLDRLWGTVLYRDGFSGLGTGVLRTIAPTLWTGNEISAAEFTVTAGNVVEINAIGGFSSSVFAALALVDGSRPQSVQATVTFLGGVAGSAGIFLDGTDATNIRSNFRMELSGNVIANTPAVGDTRVNTPPDWVVGAPHVLRCTIDAARKLRCYLDGVLKIGPISAGAAAAGQRRAGFFCTSTQFRFDDFSVRGTSL